MDNTSTVLEGTYANAIFYILCDSKFVSYTLADEWKEPTQSELVNNELINDMGLTESEKWFNTLSDQEKQYVQDLAVTTFFIGPTCG